jgi:ATP-dependent exoDNAse (exonuclease V) alpha subunit
LEGEFGRALSLALQAPFCIFITGKAGTGKSTLLKLLVEKTNKRVALLAPTGLAAVNIGGETIHSFFHFPPRPIDRDEIKTLQDRRLFQAIDAILIDEVSMVRADLMDSIDAFMRKNGKDSGQPFGGAQVVLFGDVYQLPPVVASGEEAEFLTDQYQSEFFFDADVFRDLRLEIIELTRVFRQTDPAFIQVLDAFRTGDVNNQQMATVNTRYHGKIDPLGVDGGIVLTTTNAVAGEINRDRLRRLPDPERTYLGVVTGKYPEKAFPTDIELQLRVGAQVMFVKNDINRRWVNGTLGVVTGAEENSVQVRISSGGGSVQVGRETWETLKHRYNRDHRRIETEVVGAFTQIPLKLAWAVTIHKSQGLTFDRLVVDLGKGAFAYGQTYVALSRCRSLDGIVLTRPIRQADVKVSPRVTQFLRSQTVYRPQADRSDPVDAGDRLLRTEEGGSGRRSGNAPSSSKKPRSRAQGACPHGVPRPYTCAICEPEKFKFMTGIG